MAKKNTKKIKEEINLKHIEFYNKALDTISFILDEYSKDLVRADIEYLEMSKNSISTLDFLISAIVKIQKGQRLALGLDDIDYEDLTPQINIVEGLSESKI